MGVNRREIRANNKIDFGQNPWGCFNPRMTVISFKNDEGNVVANIIHYGAHCTAAGRNTEISRDWAGVMVDSLEKESGGITAFFNGAEGDVGPRLSNGGTTGDMSHVKETGEIAETTKSPISVTLYLCLLLTKISSSPIILNKYESLLTLTLCTISIMLRSQLM